MTIPKSYEALAADLASEKILSKTLRGQKEAYMMLADKGRLDLSESKTGESALREELAALRESYEAMRDRKNSIVDLQQRLTVAENLLRETSDYLDGSTRNAVWCDSILHKKMKAALNPAADAEFSSSEFTKKSGKSARAPVGLKKDQIVEVFGGGQTQIARVDKTDWRHVEMWRVKP